MVTRGEGAYDAWGRQTAKTRGSHSASYGYRYGHYLRTVYSTIPGEQAVAAYTTGGDGKRRAALGIADEVFETHYRWDAGYTVLNEEDDAGDLERTYVGRNTAQIEGDDAATGDYLYHTHDHLGSTRQVYGQAMDLAASFYYTPYGRELLTTNRALTTRGYTGHTREAALGGAYYAPFRYYHPGLARWEKRDPLGMVDGPNVYAYVRGDVVNLWDPMGLSAYRDCVTRATKDHDAAKERCKKLYAACIGATCALSFTFCAFRCGFLAAGGPMGAMAYVACLAACTFKYCRKASGVCTTELTRCILHAGEDFRLDVDDCSREDNGCA